MSQQDIQRFNTTPVMSAVTVFNNVVYLSGQVNKSERWMPWLWEAMKDVISCDKLRVGANNL